MGSPIKTTTIMVTKAGNQVHIKIMITITTIGRTTVRTVGSHGLFMVTNLVLITNTILMRTAVTQTGRTDTHRKGNGRMTTRTMDTADKDGQVVTMDKIPGLTMGHGRIAIKTPTLTKILTMENKKSSSTV